MTALIIPYGSNAAETETTRVMSQRGARCTPNEAMRKPIIGIRLQDEMGTVTPQRRKTMSPRIYPITINIKTDKQADAVKIEKPRFYIDSTLCVDLGNYKASFVI
jgi:hypothetical protein